MPGVRETPLHDLAPFPVPAPLPDLPR